MADTGAAPSRADTGAAPSRADTGAAPSRADPASSGGAGGRRPGATLTREAILEAARATFAELGYGGATIRRIAAEAGVDPALVHHFYGSKDQLFAEALRMPETVTTTVPRLLEGGIDGAGERLARFYLGLWEDPDTRPAMLSVVRSAVAHDAAAAMMRDLVSARLLGRIGHLLPDHAELRMSLAMSHLTGLAIGRYVLAVPSVADGDVEYLIACVAPAVQRYLAEPLPA